MMDEQADLFGTPEHPSNPIEARFWVFHAENPHVYMLFCRFTSEILARGFEHFSSDAILHRIRWETAITTSEGEVIEGRVLKLNNIFTPYYSRLWARLHSEHADFFRTRRLLAGEASERLEAA